MVTVLVGDDQERAVVAVDRTNRVLVGHRESASEDAHVIGSVGASTTERRAPWRTG